MLLRRKANFSKEEACICGILQNNDSSSFSLLRDWKFTRPVGENIFHRKWNSLFRSLEIEHESIKSLWDFFPPQTLKADVTISIAFKRGTDIQVILYWSDNCATFEWMIMVQTFVPSVRIWKTQVYFLPRSEPLGNSTSYGRLFPPQFHISSFDAYFLWLITDFAIDDREDIYWNRRKKLEIIHLPAS